MFELIKSVISAGGYKLTDIQYKVKKLYLLGDITAAEMDELLHMASGGVSADAERPGMLNMIQTLAEEIKALKERVTALEGGEDEATEYPEWKPWNGISKDYQTGAIVSHKGVLWQSVFAGQNVWEPGTAENLWVKV